MKHRSITLAATTLTISLALSVAAKPLSKIGIEPIRKLAAQEACQAAAPTALEKFGGPVLDPDITTMQEWIATKKFYKEEDRKLFDERIDTVKAIMAKLDAPGKEMFIEMFGVEDFTPVFLDQMKDARYSPRSGCLRFVEPSGRAFELWKNTETQKASLIIRTGNKVRIIGRSGNEFLVEAIENGTYKLTAYDKEGNRTQVTTTRSHLTIKAVMGNLVFLSDGSEKELEMLKLTLEYGVRPARVFNFLNGKINGWDRYDPKIEIETAKACIDAAKRTKLPAWFIAAVAFQEGLAMNFESLAEDGPVSSFMDVGAEAFFSDYRSIQRYLPPDLQFTPSEPVVNEHKDRFISVKFKDIPTAVHAIAGILAGRRDRFVVFSRRILERKLTDEELLTGTYITYNAAHPFKHLKPLLDAGTLEMPYRSLIKGDQRPTIKMVSLNAARVMATARYLRYRWGDILARVDESRIGE